MVSNKINIKVFVLTALLLGASYSPAFPQQLSGYSNPWALQVYLKHLNEYKLYSDLKTFLEANYSDTELNSETRLYVLNDLADLYTTKLIDFKRADDYNKRAWDAFLSLRDRELNELPFSNYFNGKRLITKLIYPSSDLLKAGINWKLEIDCKDNPDAQAQCAASSIRDLESLTFGERSDLKTEFPPEVIEYMRKEDLRAVGEQIQKRELLLRKNIGIQQVVADAGSTDTVHNRVNIDAVDKSKTLSEYEKNYLLAKYYWEAVTSNSPADQYLPIVEFGKKAISQQGGDDPESLFLLCRLHYWVGMSYLNSGQNEPGIDHLRKFDQTIEKLDNEIQNAGESQKLFIDKIGNEIRAELLEEQKNKETWMDRWRGVKSFASGLVEAVGQVTLYTAYGMALYANAYNSAYGGQTLSYQDIDNLTEGTMNISSWMHESGTKQREEIEINHEMDVAKVQSEYFNTTQNVEKNLFLQRNSITPQQLKYARFMGPNEQLEFFINRGDALHSVGNDWAAKNFYLDALSLIEKQRATIDSDTQRMVFSGHRNSIYLKLVRIYSDEGDAAQAFHLIERSKGRVFADLLESKNIQLARNDENDYYQEYLLKNSEMNEILSHGSVGLDQVKYMEQSRGIYVEPKLFKTTPLIEFNNLDQAKPITLREARGILSKPTINSTLIQYYIAPEQIVIVLADDATTQIEKVSIDKDQLISHISRFRDLISGGSKNPDDLLDLSKSLYEILIRPVASSISNQRVIISPHGPLHYLPFQLLHDGQNYLLENHSLSYVPSATVLRYLADKSPIGPLNYSSGARAAVVDDDQSSDHWNPIGQPSPPTYAEEGGRYERDQDLNFIEPAKNILLLGNPNLEGGLLDLPFSEIEIERASKHFSSAYKLARDEASETNFKNLASSYDILHFATHAVFNSEEPFSSSLLLSSDSVNDGKLTVEEIYRLELKPSLVVLSACETGLGRHSAGDEIIGFYRAFMYAGAKSIIATLWPVADEATSFLINEFYQALNEKPLGESLRMAQLKTKEVFPDPSNWGGFVLVGRN